MAIWNLGSINADHFYEVPHIPQPGETIVSTGYRFGLGGKGANQSVAAARAGAQVTHIGAVGPDGGWAVDRLAAMGVQTGAIAALDVPTGHAIITVGADGENAIVLFDGANARQSEDRIAAVLAGAGAGDTLMLQNETDAQPAAVALARDRGMRVIYSAAPFEIAAVEAVLPRVSTLILNDVEARQLSGATGRAVSDLGVPEVVVTRGGDGVEWYGPEGAHLHHPAFPVEVVDTTGAGDTFSGYFAAARDAGEPVETALRIASAAGAIMVSRAGTADVIPTADEVAAFLRTAP